jgi:DNA-binding SARP family transcriptional activator
VPASYTGAALAGNVMQPRSIRLELLGGFSLVCDSTHVTLPCNARRVVAYLALQRRPLSRVSLASSLWMDAPEDRAGSNLRTALWRIREMAGSVVTVQGSAIELAGRVDVDVRELVTASHVLMRGGDTNVDDFNADLFARELLPDWDEEWLQLERERVRQLRMHALERISVLLSRLGRYCEAIEVGLIAVEAEPLRESAQFTVIEAHLAEGNRSEAIRLYRSYRQLLADALGVEPSIELRGLVGVERRVPQ